VNNNHYESISNFYLNSYNVDKNSIISSTKSTPTFSPIYSAISSPVFSSTRFISTSSQSIFPSLSSLSRSISP
jgi:hypothetical protein